MSNRWRIFWVASFTLVIFFQACGMHSWEELLVSTADEKKMGREFDSLVKIGNKEVIDVSKESLFDPNRATADELVLWNYYQQRGKDVVSKIRKVDLDALIPTNEPLCGASKAKCNKDNFFEFNIIKSKTVNAFAVPGGYVYFYSAIMTQFQSESELMSVMGHEIGHVVLHHSRDRIVKQVGASVIIDALLGDGMGAMLASLGTSLWLQSNGQGDESQSDSMGFYYTNELRISSVGLTDFFARGLKSYDPVTKYCNEDKEGSILDVFSTHPPSCKRVNDNTDRIAKSGQTLQTHPKDKNSVNGKNFKQLVSAAGF